MCQINGRIYKEDNEIKLTLTINPLKSLIKLCLNTNCVGNLDLGHSSLMYN